MVYRKLHLFILHVSVYELSPLQLLNSWFAGRRNGRRQSRAVSTEFERLNSDGEDDNVMMEELEGDEDVIVLNDDGPDEENDEETNQEVAEIAGPHLGLNQGMLRNLSVDGWKKFKFTEKNKHCNPPKTHWSAGNRIDPSDDTLEGASDVYQDPPKLTESAMEAARTMRPIDLFFYFMSKKFWRDVQVETNRYELQTREDRKRQLLLSPSTRTSIRSSPSSSPAIERTSISIARINAFEPIRASEIIHYVALLITRAVCPMNGRMVDHWKTKPRGAVPAGTWSRYMSKKRFMEVNKFLHFNDNKNPQGNQDRAWKIRRVVDELQRSFKAGMEMGKWLAFDEMVIPSRSSRNAIRLYLKNKPHKYGTKLFALCCGETHYCKRYSIDAERIKGCCLTLLFEELRFTAARGKILRLLTHALVLLL